MTDDAGLRHDFDRGADAGRDLAFGARDCPFGRDDLDRRMAWLSGFSVGRMLRQGGADPGGPILS